MFVARSNITSVDESGFFSGSKDRKIILMDNSANPVMEYLGHEGVVCSISQNNPDFFISGSWDATARVWSIKSPSPLFVLPNHTFSVTVLALPDNQYLTASQDCELKLWQGDQMVKKTKAHTMIVRDIKLSADKQAIYTCSNDELVKKWDLNFNLLATMKGHTSYVYNLKVTTDYLLSTSEDRYVKVWAGDLLDQELMHPNSVWDATVLNNGDIVTVCADGFIRVFTSNSERFADEISIEAYQKECLVALNEAEQGGVESVDLKSLPSTSQLNSIQGKPNEIKVFNENGVAMAYSYVPNEGWTKIGEVTGQKSKQVHYEGDKYFKKGDYDFVFDVDFEGKPLKLPFNKEDNVQETAEKFINRENMHRGYMNDVVEYLRKSSGVSGTTIHEEVKKPKIYSFQLPFFTAAIFNAINTEGPFKKIQETSTFSAEDLTIIEGILKVVGNVAFYHNSTLKKLQLDFILENLINLENPAFKFTVDVLRMTLMHPTSNELFKGPGGGMKVLTLLLEGFNQGDNVTKTLILRTFCNLFNLENGKSTVLVIVENLMNLIRSAVALLQPTITNAAIKLLYK